MKKLSLDNAQGALSRSEMKKIMAGSGSESCGKCGDYGCVKWGLNNENCKCTSSQASTQTCI